MSSDINPNADYFESAETEDIPSYTYKINGEEGRISGNTDGLEAVKQAVYKILQTERYECPIYSGSYGIELKDLYGQHFSYVCPELERRISEALLCDDRIEKAEDFSFDTSVKGEVRVSFTITTVFGKADIEKEVKI